MNRSCKKDFLLLAIATRAFRERACGEPASGRAGRTAAGRDLTRRRAEFAGREAV